MSRRHPIGSGTGGSGSPGDADDALLAAAAAPSPSPGLTAEMALSILVDCFGHQLRDRARTVALFRLRMT